MIPPFSTQSGFDSGFSDGFGQGVLTRLGLGGPQGEYGSFAGKVASVVTPEVPVEGGGGAHFGRIFTSLDRRRRPEPQRRKARRARKKELRETLPPLEKMLEALKRPMELERLNVVALQAFAPAAPPPALTLADVQDVVVVSLDAFRREQEALRAAEIRHADELKVLIFLEAEQAQAGDIDLLLLLLAANC